MHARDVLTPLIAAALLTTDASAAPIPVTLEQAEEGWSLRRDGEVYVIRGGGGNQDPALLALSGGNSTRTWGIGDDTAALLDAAHEAGLTVALGIWLGHKRHAFDYSDPGQVAAQLEAARDAVRTYRDHPAVLLWGVGNEMEGFEEGDDPRIWSAVCEVAEAVKALDPNHPVMTVTADIGGGRVAAVSGCEAIDIHGVNSYGGALSLPDRYAEAGGQKPLIITEYGPAGTWEIPFTDYGAPPELTSTQKAEVYARIWQEAIAARPSVLGGYAFLWGWKVEATATWYGLFLPDGTRLGGVDALARAWGTTPFNLSPVVSPLTAAGGDAVNPGEKVTVSWTIKDPEGDPVSTDWELRWEVRSYFTGGDDSPLPPRVDKAVLESSATSVTLRMPDTPGAYRLYATARDGQGGGANASLPLLVGEPVAPDGPASLPWWLYQDDGVGGPWAPSGWMGDIEAITHDTGWTEGCASAPSCIKVVFDSQSWGGVAWQHPANDWGDRPGGVDLSEARWLTFKVRSDFNLREVAFGVGLLEDDKAYPDSMRKEKTVKLTTEWQTVRIRLRGDRSQIKTGFYWVAPIQGPVTFYLDDIVFE